MSHFGLSSVQMIMNRCIRRITSRLNNNFTGIPQHPEVSRKNVEEIQAKQQSPNITQKGLHKIMIFTLWLQVVPPQMV